MVQCGTITVQRTFDPGAVRVQDCSLFAVSGSDPSNPVPSDKIRVDVTVANSNDVGAGVTVSFSVGGAEFAAPKIKVPANGSTDVSRAFTPQEVNVSAGQSATVEVDLQNKAETSTFSISAADRLRRLHG